MFLNQILLVGIVFTALSSWAAVPRFGPEFTFSHPQIKEGPAKLLFDPVGVVNLSEENRPYIDGIELFVNNYLAHLHKHLINNQTPDSQFVRGFHEFLSPSGWAFQVETDVGVIEVKMDPMIWQDYAKYKDDIQDAIFVSAHNQGLFPFDYLGGGHINIDLYSFENSLHLRNFIVDFYNHAELSMGVFGYDTNNALSLWMNPKQNIKAFHQVIASFDRGEYDGKPWYVFIGELSAALQTRPSDPFFREWHAKESTKARNANHAINFIHATQLYDRKSRRLELRAVRPQKSMDVFVRQIRLLAGRIAYLSEMDQPIPLKPGISLRPFSANGDAKLNPPVDPQEALAHFYQYVKESDEDWTDHQDYLWPQWENTGEVEKFNRHLASQPHSSRMLFGPEFTFSNVEMVKEASGSLAGVENSEVDGATLALARPHEMSKILLEHMSRHLIGGQPTGAKFTKRDNTLTSPNGWWVKVSHDFGVVEVTARPMPWQNYARFREDIQDAVFVSAANNGLFPMDYLGGGHINLNVGSFETGLLLRNFIVDFFNHAELSMGVFSYDTNNALPFWLNTPHRIRKIYGVIEKFDSGLYATTDEFLQGIRLALRSGQNDLFAKTWNTRRFKGYALSVGSEFNIQDNRIEIRSVRPQKSMDVFVRQIRLLQGRIDFLRTISMPIPLQSKIQILDHVPFQEAKLEPPVDPMEALRAFDQYLQESGERWEDHRDYLWPRWIQEGLVERYERRRARGDFLGVFSCGTALGLIGGESSD